VNKSELLKAVRFLEAGDWQAAHKLVQKDEDSALACWAHGIVHLLEGDASNARYWYRQAKRSFPSAGEIESEIAELRRSAGSKSAANAR
jgi:Tfp pilus assembly protein PilF